MSDDKGYFEGMLMEIVHYDRDITSACTCILLLLVLLCWHNKKKLNVCKIASVVGSLVYTKK